MQKKWPKSRKKEDLSPCKIKALNAYKNPKLSRGSSGAKRNFGADCELNVSFAKIEEAKKNAKKTSFVDFIFCKYSA